MQRFSRPYHGASVMAKIMESGIDIGFVDLVVDGGGVKSVDNVVLIYL